VAKPAGGRRRLEVAGRLVIVCLRIGAGVGDVEVLGRQGGRDIATKGIAVAAVEGADLPLGEQFLAGRREFGCVRLRDDRPADAIAAQTDRCNAGINLEAADIARINIGQRRVHVVGTGSNQVHAIDRHAQSIIGQAMDRRQAGNAACTIKTDSRHIAQQARGIAGGRAQRRQLAAIDGTQAG